jgi:iron complex outermembrane receptor protein
VLTAQTELKLPVSTGIEAFVRGNMAYRPDNPNASDAIVIQSYLIANMFAGIRDPEGDWELSVFANNAFNKQQILGLDAIDITSSSPATQFFPQGSSGYRGAAFTPRREIGLSLRYAFGAR